MNYFFIFLFFWCGKFHFSVSRHWQQTGTTETEGFIFFPPMEERPKKNLDLAWHDSNLMSVLVCWGCCNEVPQTGYQATESDCITVWGLQVWDWGVSRVGSLGRSWGKSIAASLPGLQVAVSSLCLPITFPLYVSVSKCPLLVRTPVLWDQDPP